jgi:hypothetical protein
MVQHGVVLTLSLISSAVLCQASSFIHEDILAYPRYKVELAEKKISESSVFGQQQVRSITHIISFFSPSTLLTNTLISPSPNRLAGGIPKIAKGLTTVRLS